MSSVERVRNKQAQAEGVPGVPLPQVPAHRHAARGRAPRPRARRPPEVPARARPARAQHAPAPAGRYQSESYCRIQQGTRTPGNLVLIHSGSIKSFLFLRILKVLHVE